MQVVVIMLMRMRSVEVILGDGIMRLYMSMVTRAVGVRMSVTVGVTMRVAMQWWQ